MPNIRDGKTAGFIYNSMNAEVKEEWVSALRGKRYKQGSGYLRVPRNTSSGKVEDRFCCLGVLCDLYAKSKGVEWKENFNNFGSGAKGILGEDCYLPRKVAEWAGIESSRVKGGFNFIVDGVAQDLTSLNDDGTSFKKIASLIEKQVVGK